MVLYGTVLRASTRRCRVQLSPRYQDPPQGTTLFFLLMQAVHAIHRRAPLRKGARVWDGTSPLPPSAWKRRQFPRPPLPLPPPELPPYPSSFPHLTTQTLWAICARWRAVGVGTAVPPNPPRRGGQSRIGILRHGARHGGHARHLTRDTTTEARTLGVATASPASAVVAAQLAMAMARRKSSRVVKVTAARIRVVAAVGASV